jgi:hypothetical protein
MGGAPKLREIAWNAIQNIKIEKRLEVFLNTAKTDFGWPDERGSKKRLAEAMGVDPSYTLPGRFEDRIRKMDEQTAAQAAFYLGVAEEIRPDREALQCAVIKATLAAVLRAKGLDDSLPSLMSETEIARLMAVTEHLYETFDAKSYEDVFAVPFASLSSAVIEFLSASGKKFVSKAQADETAHLAIHWAVAESHLPVQFGIVIVCIVMWPSSHASAAESNVKGNANGGHGTEEGFASRILSFIDPRRRRIAAFFKFIRPDWEVYLRTSGQNIRQHRGFTQPLEVEVPKTLSAVFLLDTMLQTNEPPKGEFEKDSLQFATYLMEQWNTKSIFDTAWSQVGSDSVPSYELCIPYIDRMLREKWHAWPIRHALVGRFQ